MDTANEALLTDRAYYIAGMVVVAQALGKLPIGASITLGDDWPADWNPGAVRFRHQPTVEVSVYAYDRKTGGYRQRSEAEAQAVAQQTYDTEAAIVYMGGRAAVTVYHGRGDAQWGLAWLPDTGRQAAFELAEKYRAGVVDQLLFVESAYLRALRILGQQSNRRGVQVIAQALIDGQRLAADDIGALLSKSRVRPRRRSNAP